MTYSRSLDVSILLPSHDLIGRNSTLVPPATFSLVFPLAKRHFSSTISPRIVYLYLGMSSSMRIFFLFKTYHHSQFLHLSLTHPSLTIKLLIRPFPPFPLPTRHLLLHCHLLHLLFLPHPLPLLTHPTAPHNPWLHDAVPASEPPGLGYRTLRSTLLPLQLVLSLKLPFLLLFIPSLAHLMFPFRQTSPPFLNLLPISKLLMTHAG